MNILNKLTNGVVVLIAVVILSLGIMIGGTLGAGGTYVATKATSTKLDTREAIKTGVYIGSAAVVNTIFKDRGLSDSEIQKASENGAVIGWRVVDRFSDSELDKFISDQKKALNK